MIRITIITLMIVTGIFIVFNALYSAGSPINSLFADPAEKIRAEAEVKRVEVALMKAQTEHIERMELIKLAAAPRTPLIILCLIGLLCSVCGALFFSLMREKEKRRQFEQRVIKIARSQKAKKLSGNGQKPARIQFEEQIERRESCYSG